MSDSTPEENGLIGSFIAEAKRRHLFRASGLYAGAAFVLLQIADIVLPGMGMGESAITILLLVSAAGFPLTLVVVWLLDLSGDRAQAPGRFVDAVIFVLAVGVGYMYLERLLEGAAVSRGGEPVAARESLEPASSADQQDQEITRSELMALRNSIAVLPFANLSPDPDNAFFALGVHEEILNHLTKISELSVIARTSVMQYAGVHKPVSEIAAELGVGTIMEGSVRYAGNRVRVTVQLIDAASGSHLWSETYDRELTDVFQIESDIAANITEAMKVEFSSQDENLQSRQPTNNIEAYTHYLRAMANLSTTLAFKPVFDDLDRAIQLDPNFIEALELKSYLHAANIISGAPDMSPTNLEEQEEHLRAAETYAERALTLDSTSARANTALSIVSEVKREWSERPGYSYAAMESDPGDLLVVFERARVLLHQGELEEAKYLFKMAQALDPRNTLVSIYSSGQMLNVGEWQDALEWSRLTIQQSPENPVGYAAMAMAEWFLGNEEAAKEALEMADGKLNIDVMLAAPNGFNLFLMNNLVYVAWVLEDEESYGKFMGYMNGLYDQLPDDGRQAFRYMLQGEAERAAGYLLQVARENFPAGTNTIVRYHHMNPIFDSLRDQPDFHEALRILQVNP